MAKKKRRINNKKQVVTNSYSKKIWFSFWTTIMFAIISLVCLGIGSYIDPIQQKFLSTIFWMLGLLSGFIALAFLVIWLIFLIMKLMKK